MKKLNSWFEIDEREYLMYVLRGYEFYVTEDRVIWTLDGKYHREDGPAIIHSDGSQEWWIDGEQIAIQEAGYDQG